MPGHVKALLGPSAWFLQNQLSGLFTFMALISHGEDVLRDEKNWTMCNAILSFVEDELDKEQRYGKMAWYSSTEKLLFNFVEQNSGRV